MYTFVSAYFPSLTEADQNNSLRWVIVKKDKKTLTQAAREMKCKDYFNDIVAFYQTGKVFSVYGFQNDVPFGKTGLFVVLRNIANKEMFKKNIAVLNEAIKKDLGCTIKVLDGMEKADELLIRFPFGMLNSTYTMSLATMLIRCSNYGKEFTSWESFFGKDSPLNTVERSFTASAKKLVQEYGFKNPRDTWCYCFGATTDELVKGQSWHAIHNCGVSCWADAITYNQEEECV